MAKTPEERDEYMRQYRQTHRALGIPIRDASTWEENQINRLRRYGLDMTSYTNLFNSQGGKCAVCSAELKLRNTKEDRSFNTHIDHCPTTGRVRGLLCAGCNLGIGHLKDDPARLIAAAAYLKP